MVPFRKERVENKLYQPGPPTSSCQFSTSGSLRRPAFRFVEMTGRGGKGDKHGVE